MSIIPVGVIPVTPLASYVAPYPSIGNITPFTYRDGTTYLEVLYNLQDYINSTVIPFINATIGMPSSDFQTQVNVLITTINANILAEETRVNTALASQTTANNTAITNLTNYVNAQVASIVGSSITVQDSGVSTLVNTPASLTTVALKSLYANKDTETVVSTGRLTDVNLQAEFALKSVETIVTAGRLTDVNLKTEFAGKAYEPTVDSLGVLTGAGRLADINLQGEFALKSVETIVTSGRLSQTAINAISDEVNSQGIIKVIPTSVSGTNVILQGASVVVLSAGGANIDIKGVFTTATKYRIEIPRIVSSGLATLGVRLILGSTVISSTTYDFDLAYRSGTSAVAAQSASVNNLSLSGANTNATKFGWIELYNVSQILKTGFDWKLGETSNAGGGIGQTVGMGFQNDTVAYDGIEFFLSAGTFMSAEIAIYAYI